MDVQQLAEGLWSWVPAPGALHSFYYEPAAPDDGSLILFDPVLPGDGTELARFWRALDRDVRGSGRAVAIVIGDESCRFDAAKLRRRYEALGVGVKLFDSESWKRPGWTDLTGTVRALPLVPGSDPQPVFELRACRAIVFEQAVAGCGGRIELSAVDRVPRRVWDELLATDPWMLLPRQGEPVLREGRAVLARTLA